MSHSTENPGSTLLDEVSERLADSEHQAHEMRERIAALEALAARGMHPQPGEIAQASADRILDLARRTKQLQATLEALSRRLTELEAISRGVQPGD